MKQHKNKQILIYNNSIYVQMLSLDGNTDSSFSKRGYYFDRIKMTKNWLKYDFKIWQWKTLLIEYDQKMLTTVLSW